jgi:hypothetical protein
MPTSTETGRRRSQIFYRMREFVGSREGDPCGFGWPRCAAAFYRNRRRRSNHVAKGSDTSATRVLPYLLPAAPEAPSWPVCRSLGGGSRFYSISERSVSRLSLPEPPSSVSPVWSKHRRQSPLVTRNAVSHRGHSSGSCVIAGSRSVKPSYIIGEGKSQRRGVIFMSLAPHWPPARRRGDGVHRQCQQDSPLFGPLHRATTSGNAAACDTVTFSPYFREPPTS